MAEALDVRAEGPAGLLTHGAEIVVREAALVRALEVGDEAPAEILPGVDGLSGEVVSHEDAESLRAMGNQFAMTLSSPPAAWMARV